jgi:hypothetical protein
LNEALAIEWIEERAGAEAVVAVDVNWLTEMELQRLESWAFWLVMDISVIRVLICCRDRNVTGWSWPLAVLNFEWLGMLDRLLDRS